MFIKNNVVYYDGQTIREIPGDRRIGVCDACNGCGQIFGAGSFREEHETFDVVTWGKCEKCKGQGIYVAASAAGLATTKSGPASR